MIALSRIRLLFLAMALSGTFAANAAAEDAKTKQPESSNQDTSASEALDKMGEDAKKVGEKAEEIGDDVAKSAGEGYDAAKEAVEKDTK